MGCIICGKEMPIQKPRRQKYCSEKCSDRAYYIRHKTKIIKRVIKYNRENPEKCKKWSKKSVKKFRTEKRERFNKLMLESYKRNRRRWNVRNRTNYYRQAILDAFGNKCQKCRSKDNLEIHHKKYEWKINTGRYNDLNNSVQLNIDNLNLFCTTCHKKKRELSTLV